MPSAAKRISTSRSSLPFPSGLATELILFKISISYFLFLLCSGLSNIVLPLTLSRYSAESISLSTSIASLMNLLASYSISISSMTYSFSYFTHFASNSSRIILISFMNLITVVKSCSEHIREYNSLISKSS